MRNSSQGWVNGNNLLIYVLGSKPTFFPYSRDGQPNNRGLDTHNTEFPIKGGITNPNIRSF